MSTTEDVRIAETDEEIQACFPVLHALRPHLQTESFVERVRGQMEDGYRLAFIAADGTPVAVAGFRLGRNLAWGPFLYVDDLVTSERTRSRGHGAALLGWLVQRARSAGCAQLHLDSGTQRKRAHAFYEREGLAVTSLHFGIQL